MNYRINGFTVRSHNSAKPATQASCYVINLLRSKGPFEQAVDYGCGKLRYAGVLAERSNHLTIVDSSVQIRRKQMLFNKRTSVEKLAPELWPNCSVFTLEEFASLTTQRHFDFALCANVLSAIPSYRKRAALVDCIYHCLADGGDALFVTQYRNSYFDEVYVERNALPHLDGFLIPRNNAASFYGIIDHQDLLKLGRKQGFRHFKVWTSRQSAFLLATR